MFRNFLFFIFALTLSGVAAFAQEEAELNTRKGFFLGFGVNGSYEMKELKEAGGGLKFRIGGGLNDSILLMYNGYADIFAPNQNGLEYTATFSGGEFAAQFFFLGNNSGPYMLGGAGFAVAIFDDFKLNGTDLINSSESRLGISVTAAGGWEFRLGRSFVLQPEIAIHYLGLFNTDDLLSTNVVQDTWKTPIIDFGLNFIWYL